MGKWYCLNLAPIRTAIFPGKNISAVDLTNVGYQIIKRTQVFCEKSMDNLEWRGMCRIGRMPVMVQQLDILGLIPLGKMQNKLVAGEGISHFPD